LVQVSINRNQKGKPDMAGRILIVDSVATNRIVMKVVLASAFYEPVLADSGAACLRLARDGDIELILLDLSLSDMPGITVLQHLRADPMTRTVPVVILSATDDAAERLDALKAGADEVLAKSTDHQTLLARVRNLLRGRPIVEAEGLTLPELAESTPGFDHPGHFALVTGHIGASMRLRRDLSQLSHHRITTLLRQEALVDDGATPDAGNTLAPDVYVIDADLGGPGGGLLLMSELHSRPSTRDAGICILRSPGDLTTTAMAFDLGADAVVQADITGGELLARLHRILRRKRDNDRQRARLRDGLRLSLIDPLTGLHNRRYAIPHLAGIAARALAEDSPFAVMVVDLDRFKTVNDRWGHAAGDTVLIEVARRLAAALRPSDLLARIGGEEFLIALPATGATEAQAIAERLCQAVEETAIGLQQGVQAAVTISVGLAISPHRGMPVPAEQVGKMVERADHALMQSKLQGRNKVTIWPSAA
jgi:two-component system, cell cycle response regulator